MNPSVANLVQLIKELRDTDGCAWTKAQTFESLAPMTVDESYELLDAIVKKDPDAIKNELGDLLYHIVFYAELAHEQGLFDFSDITQVMIDKHHQRMPRDHKNLSAEAINAHWEQRKSTTDLMAQVKENLPPLIRAFQLQAKAAQVGFDWEQTQQILDKIREETAELAHEVDQSSAHIAEECGDLLFCCVNLIRHLELNPETVLTQANHKFVNRFNYIESQLAQDNIKLDEASLEQMEALWQQAKKQGY